MYLCTLLYSKENLFTRVWKKAIFKPFNLPLLSDIVFYTYHCFILLVLVLVICSVQSRSSEVLTPKNTFRSGRKGRSGMKVAQIHWTCTLLKYSFSCIHTISLTLMLKCDISLLFIHLFCLAHLKSEPHFGCCHLTKEVHLLDWIRLAVQGWFQFPRVGSHGKTFEIL